MKAPRRILCAVVSLGALACLSIAARAASAAPADEPVATPTTVSATASAGPPVVTHANPRLKLSYRQFSVSNLDGTGVPLKGIELDVYPLSTRWIRMGLDLEAGRGQATVLGHSIQARYGLLGVVGGFQYPARITPFVEGRLVGGVLGGTLDGPLTIPGTTLMLNGTSVATYIYGGGIDIGADVFALGRGYVSVSLGWLRTTWGGLDYAAMIKDPLAGIQFKNLTDNSFTLKLGVGF